VKLSILYFGHVGAVVDLLGEADRLGFTRFWLGEHHTGGQCTNPLLLGALLAATSQGIRVGSGGVCLDYQSPLRVAEDACLIEFLLSGRFDLGVTRGLPLEPTFRDAMLDGRPPGTLRPYDERLTELHGLLTRRLPPEHPLAGYKTLESGPPLWVLGGSVETARWAGRHGTGFCLSLHHTPDFGGVAILDEYRRHFVPSPEFEAPEAIVVASVACAPTREEALEILRAHGLNGSTVAGSAAECHAELANLADRYGVEEMMLLFLLPVRGTELTDTYQALAQLAGVMPHEPLDG
jgi:luciferase family oxidoreductase group 1